MTCSQLIHGSRQPIRGCGAPLPNWRDDWSWLLGWVSHGECTSVYASTLDRTYDMSSSYDLTKLLHCVVSQPWENIEFVLKLVMTLTYGWNCELIIYSLWIRSLLMEVDSNRYLNRGTMLSHGIETVCLLGWS